MLTLSQPQRKLIPALLLAAGLAAFLTAAGTLGFFNGDEGNDGVGEWAINVAVIVVAVLVIWLWASRWLSATSPNQAAFRTLVFGVLTLLVLPVFWLGLHPMFAVATVLMASLTQTMDASGSQRMKIYAALGVAGVGFVLASLGNLFG